MYLVIKMNNTKLIATKQIKFDGNNYLVWKGEVNVRNNNRKEKVFIKKI